MSNTDLHAFFEGLDDSAAAAAAEVLDIENIIANFSTEMLRMNKDIPDATAMNEISINHTLKALCEKSGRRTAVSTISLS